MPERRNTPVDPDAAPPFDSPDRHRPLQPEPQGDLREFLYRPIVFSEPGRVVDPPSWLEHIPFAYWIVDALGPSLFVELGTHSGNSYAAFAQAIQMLGLSTAAYAVDTWLGDSQAGFYDERVFDEWSHYHDRQFSSFSRLVRSTFEEAAEHFPDGDIDLLHIDGCHTYEALTRDFTTWRPKLSVRGVVILHDINVRERDFGAWRVWEELRRERPTFAFLHGHGLGVVGVGSELPPAVRWLLTRSDEGEICAIRQFFAQLGKAVSGRFGLEQLDRHIRSEERPGAAARTTLEALHVRLATGADEIARLEEITRAQAVDLAGHAARAATLEAQLSASTNRVATIEEELSVTIEQMAGVSTQLSAALAQAAGVSEQLSAAEHRYADELKQKARIVAALRERIGELSWRSPRVTDPVTAPGQAVRPDPVSVGRWRRVGRRVRQMAAFPAALGLLPGPGRGIKPSSIILLAHPRKVHDAWFAFTSGLFDDAYYRQRNPDVASSRMSPLGHFVLKGAAEDRDPHPLFSISYYLRHNPDVASADVNPLTHYCRLGAFEARSPHALFDQVFYQHMNPDVVAQRVEPLRHFLRTGAAEGRNPNPHFDCAYYLSHAPDVAASAENPLVHYATNGWREGRRPSPTFDANFYRSRHQDVNEQDVDPLAHYLEYGVHEGRQMVSDEPSATLSKTSLAASPPPVALAVTSLGPSQRDARTVLCLSHVWPLHPRAGNEYRIQQMLRWFRQQGFRVIPVIAPLPGEDVHDSHAVRALADEFSNAVLCHRDGRVEYVLRDVPDVLAGLAGTITRPFDVLLGEEDVTDDHGRELLEVDRVFCHDALIATVLRLHHALGPHVFLSEYIWMSRVLPLISGEVVTVIDTIDVFSTKRDKVLNFGIDDLHVEPHEEARRLRRADLIVAIQDDERRELARLVPSARVVTAGVDLDVATGSGVPTGRRVLYVASDNPMNKKGLQDFLRFAWPSIREHVPDAELLVAGRIGSTLTVPLPGVVRLGLVDDLRPVYEQASLVINPAVAGTGLKIKTLEALGHLRTVVTWPSGTDGLAPELAALCVSVRDWYDFSRAVIRLLTTDEPGTLSPHHRATLVRLTSPAAAYGALTAAIDDLLAPSPRSRWRDGRNQ